VGRVMGGPGSAGDNGVDLLWVLPI
jgi:hypothetical protein